MNAGHSWIARVAMTIAATPGGIASLDAADEVEAEIRALRREIQRLEQRMAELEKLEESRAKGPPAPAAAESGAPRISLTEKGFTFASADAANTLRIRGLVQLDSRWYAERGGGTAADGFVLRRARLIAEGTLGRIYSFQLVPEFGGTGAPSILDANLAVVLSGQTRIRAGKFKTPIGLELLQTDAWTFFDERSLATNLVPNRDLGVELSGGLGDTFTYAAGIFNGLADGASSTNANPDGAYAGVVRAFLRPFASDETSPWRGLGFGIGASLGRQNPASALTGGYKTDGQQTFFRYRGTTVGAGRAWRLAPQAEYRRGPWGAIGEYVVSTVTLRSGAAGTPTTLRHRAWQVAAGCVLTGEDSSYGGVTPRRPFNPNAGSWGAWEVAARYAALQVDSGAFPLLADPTAGAQGASSFGVGLSWYLSRSVRTTIDFFETSFESPLSAPARPDEQVLISRLQHSF